MKKPFTVSIISPQQVIYEGEAVSLSFRCESGYMEVLADHAATVANLVPGQISLRFSDGQQRLLEVQGKGFVEINHNAATLLLNNAIPENA